MIPGPASLVSILISCLAPLALLWIWRRAPWAPALSARVARVTPWLEGRSAAIAAGIAAGALVLAVWGSTSEPPVIHDEQAILLQARIFAMGRWRGPTPPEPEFFEQMHVFLEPGVASKYPPVHSAMLVPGVWLHQPGLMPMLLTGVAAAMFFVMVRNAFGGWVALLSCALAVTSTPELFWRSSYFSEVTTSALWMVMLWAFIGWRETRRPGLLALVAVCGSLMTLTRPLTGVLLSLPIVTMTAYDVLRDRLWSQGFIAAMVAVALSGVVPLWSERTLDKWPPTPYEEYSRVYAPFDRPGFGIDPAPAARAVPPDLVPVLDAARSIHAWHVPSRLPAIAAERLFGLMQQLGAGWRWGVLVLCLSALGGRGLLERLLVSSAACLLAGYLYFANGVFWTVYYLEVFPVVPLLAVVQLARLASRQEPVGERRRASAEGLLAVSLLLAVPLMAWDVSSARTVRQRELAFHRSVVRDLEQVSKVPATVFVRYGSTYDPKLLIVSAPVDGTNDPVWVVRDMGARNVELCSAAPDRTPYEYDVSSHLLRRGGCEPDQALRSPNLHR